jgi:Zn-dependent membrane protease YugP
LIGILVINVFPGLIWIGILLFASTTVFSFITLPVEVDASRRALSWLSQSNITTAQTSNQASDALRSAAYTYVVGAISSLGTLLYYISIARRD